MDIQIEKKTGWKRLATKKAIPYYAGAVLLVFVVWLAFRDYSSTLKVDVTGLNITTVKSGEFNDYVRVTGQVQPIKTVQLSPLEAGIVEKIVIEEGSSVRQGDVIVELSNHNLSLQILDAEAQLAEKQNFLRNTVISMEQEKLSLKQERLQLNIDVARKERLYRQNEALYNKKLLSKEEWMQAKEDYELARDKRDLIIERQKQDSIYRTVQIEQLDNDLANMRRNMSLIRERVANLKIKSPITGELGQLDIVLGQSLSMGEKIGQINDLQDYKIEAQIDEHYIDRVKSGLDATFERQGVSYNTTVRKVYPEVRNGQFKADFVFSGNRPDNIRTGQTYYLNLQLGQPVQAIIVPRGAFYQSTGGNWIYVVKEGENKAVKRNVKIGRQNPQYYEVLEGLEPGEKVIISSYDTFGDNEVLIW
ncbi:MAG: efflux RND transporter periplasmic adaptor subunit [Bacteroidales bacterium]|nr:efflux RND transporter periplasmic adaptor subunit [Bacteroidales bacterium]